jgi:hypothetical protein
MLFCMSHDHELENTVKWMVIFHLGLARRFKCAVLDVLVLVSLLGGEQWGRIEEKGWVSKDVGLVVDVRGLGYFEYCVHSHFKRNFHQLC